jgi:hypothetical protein
VTGISKTLEVVGSILGPLSLKSGALRLLVVEVADGILLADVALKIDVGPGGASVLLHGDEVDAEVALAELLLKLDVGSGGNSLNQHLDSILEVIEVTLVRGLGEESPSFIVSLVGDVVVVEFHLVLALESVMTFFLAVLADLGLRRAVASLMTLLIASATGTGEDTRLVAFGLGVTFLTLRNVSGHRRYMGGIG